MAPSRTILGFALVLLASPAAAARMTGQDAVDLRQNTRVGDLDAPIDEGIADISALGTSLRVIDPGLTAPMDFGSVYRVPGMPSMLMRIAGGIIAVFPQSVYNEAGAEVPPGTVFYIGGLPDELHSILPPVIPASAMEPAEQPLDKRGVPIVVSDRDLDAGWTTRQSPTIANDALYRSRRIAQLMDEAARRALDQRGLPDNR